MAYMSDSDCIFEDVKCLKCNEYFAAYKDDPNEMECNNCEQNIAAVN